MIHIMDEEYRESETGEQNGEVTEQEIYTQDLHGKEDVHTQKRITRRKILLGAIPLVIAAIVVGLGLSPIGKYQYAIYMMDKGNYEEAGQKFAELGEYKDAAALYIKAQKMQLYQQAETFMNIGDYDAAYLIYNDLGNFMDALGLKEDAKRLSEIKATYDLAEMLYNDKYCADAYEEINKIKGENFPGTQELIEKIKDGAYEQLLEFIEDDEMGLARYYLELLESERYAPVEGIWEEIKEEKYMELDTSYFDNLANTIRSIKSPVTAADYAEIIKYMYMGNISRYTLQFNNVVQHHSKAGKTFMDGIQLIDMLLPDYASVYNQTIQFNGNEYGNITSGRIDIEPTNAESMEEANQHIQGIKEYCEETVRMMNDELLITNTMSNQEKARVIMNWVCSYLDYDYSLKIYDAYVAIQNELGVCESYVAIYNYMCNLAGVPTYGQIGNIKDKDSGHVWSIQLDEDGNIFYTDPTWADTNSIVGQGITMEKFIEKEEQAAKEKNSFYGYSTVAEPSETYFWQSEIWESHIPIMDAEGIQELYRQHTK